MTLSNETSIEAALTAMRGRSALLVGDYVLDAYIFGETARVSREAPVLVVRRESTSYCLGGAANTAANLVALGLKTHVIGALAEDDAGQTLRRLFQERHVDTSLLHTTTRATSVKTRILAGAFGTARQQVLRLDEEPRTPESTDILERIANTMLLEGKKVDVVLVSDYGAGAVTGPVIEAARMLARSGALVCVDSRYQLNAFAGVTAVTPNASEAEGASGIVIDSAEAVKRAGEKIVQHLAGTHCLLTQGKHGMTLFTQAHAPFHVDIVGVRDVTDVTGAGDTVLATFSAGLAAGIGLNNATAIANCAAGIVVGKAGAATADFHEIVAAAKQGGVVLHPFQVQHG